GEKDDDEDEEVYNHLMYDINDSEEGSKGKNGEEEVYAQGKGVRKEVSTRDQRTPSLTREQIEEAVEREVAGIIKNL
ncbi:hypothetical protein KI387_041218, partial [Taxus chinensis]